MDYKKIDNIGIVTRPLGKAGNTPLSNLIYLLNPLSNHIYLIAGKNFSIKIKNIHIIKIKVRTGNTIFSKILRNMLIQIKISTQIFKQKDVNLWIFFLDSHALLLPVLVSKILSKQIIFLLAASIRKSNDSKKDPLTQFLIWSEYLNFRITNGIIVYSENIVKDWNLTSFNNKIFIASEHILNFEKFRIIKSFDKRSNLIGYVGRLSNEKGIVEFLNAIPKILNKRENLKFIICGDGPLREEVESFLDVKNLNSNVTFLGWISHEELPNILNELKLLVIPSHSEGLPNILLEAMACGTPVLSTSVGSIPDVITSKTGYLMNNNSPNCISKNVLKVMNNQKLENISNKASKMVKTRFNYNKNVNRWFNLLNNFK